MSVRLKTLILVLIMGVGAFGGAPLSAADNGKQNCPMKCCKKKAASEKKKTKPQNSFCRLTSCLEIVPSAPGISTASTAVSAFLNKAESFEFHFAVSAKPRAPGELTFDNTSSHTKSVPIYVRHSSLLI